MMSLDYKKFAFSYVGFLVLGLLSTMVVHTLSFIFPLLVGIVLPLVNWKDLGKAKIARLFAMSIVSVSLFYLSIYTSFLLGMVSIYCVYAIGGISAVCFLALAKILVPSISYAAALLLFVFAMGVLAFPTAFMIGKLSNDIANGSNFVFGTWTVMVGFGLSLAQQKEQIA